MATKTTKIIDKIGSHITKTGGVLTAIVAIVGILAGVFTWLSNQVNQSVSAQLNTLQEEVEANSLSMSQQITRLELLNLIHNQPNNRAEIEKVARHYFIELDGDWYMTGIYSEWADTYGGDVSFVIKEN